MNASVTSKFEDIVGEQEKILSSIKGAALADDWSVGPKSNRMAPVAVKGRCKETENTFGLPPADPNTLRDF